MCKRAENRISCSLVLIEGSGLLNALRAERMCTPPPPSRAQKHLVVETAAFQPSFQAGQPEAQRSRMAPPGSEATSTGAA